MNPGITMDNFAEYKMKHNMKEPIILLERCDKILNIDTIIVNRKHDTESKDEYLSDKSASPYVKYQPLLCNGNDQFPYFNLSIQQTKSLISCEICGKGFSSIKNKNVHAIGAHKVSLAVKTRRKRKTNVNTNSNDLEDSQNANILDKTKSTSYVALTKKLDIIENGNLLQGDKAMSNITEQTAAVKDTEMSSNPSETENKNVMKVSRCKVKCKSKTNNRTIAVANVKENEKNIKSLNALSLLKHKDIQPTVKSTIRTPKSPGKCPKNSPSKSPGKSLKANSETWSISKSPAKNLLKSFMISSPEQTLMRRWLLSDQTSCKSTPEPLLKRIKIERDDFPEIPLKTQDESEPGRATPVFNTNFSEQINNSETSSNHQVTSIATDSTVNSTPNNSPASDRNKTVLRHNGMTMLPPPANVICTLCNKMSKNIKKHIVEYHKVTDPCLLVQESIAQSYFKDLMGSTDKKKDQTYKLDTAPETKEKAQLKKRRCNSFEIDETTKEKSHSNAKRSKPNKPHTASPKVSNTTPKDNNDTRLERKSSTESNSKKKRTIEKKTDKNSMYSCNICQKTVHGKYRLDAHNKAHARRGETLENINKCDQKSSHKSHRKSKKHKRAKSLESMTHITTKLNGVDECMKQAKKKKSKASKEAKSKQTIQTESRDSERLIKCTCGIAFSNVTVFDEHKIYCESNNRDSNVNQSVASPISKTLSHGLSLTIKKKNNSYEIVHRDTVDEEMSNVSSHTKTNEPPSEISVTSSENAGIEDIIKEKNIHLEQNQNRFPNFMLNMQLQEEDNNNIPTDVLGKKQQEADKILENSEALQLPDNRTLDSGNITSQIMNEHRCIICEKFFSNKSEIMKHWSQHVPKMLCDCQENIIKMQDYEDHIHKIHPEIVTCGYCAKKFETLFDFGEHRCAVTKGKPLKNCKTPYPCLKCNKKFDKGVVFDRHVEKFHPDTEKPFQCYNCSQRFATKDERKQHIANLHSKIACNVCYKLCTHGLKNKHESYHYGMGFPCHVCKKAYLNKESFTHHIMATHISKIQCVICKKILKVSSFKKHFKRHQNQEGLLQCILCNKTFSANEDLINHHMEKHNFEKSCEICGMNFLTKSSVEQHIANAHPNVYENRNIIKEEVTLDS